MPLEENAFSPYVRILARGKHASRNFTQAEAFELMNLILEKQVAPEQLGAVLMLMRLKEETAEEMAGFVAAIRKQTNTSTVTKQQTIDIDWPSYAGKKKQPAWFILALLLLANEGFKIIVHGHDGHTKNRYYSKTYFQELGLPICDNSEQLNHVMQSNLPLAYVPLALFSPIIADIIDLRPLFGVRSPLHSIARMINPYNANLSVHGIFHPAYRPRHIEASVLLGDKQVIAFKGDGGENEIIPHANNIIEGVNPDGKFRLEMARTISEKPLAQENISSRRLQSFWRGEEKNTYANEAVIQTAALLLKQLKNTSQDDARSFSETLWHRRNKKLL